MVYFKTYILSDTGKGTPKTPAQCNLNFAKEKFEEAEKLENLKNKVLKYIIYKKRTEAEIRQKFAVEDQDRLEDVIEYLKEQGYINDKNYIERAIKEYTALKNLSIKELVYKLSSKGIYKDLIDDYICKNKESMLEYEISSAKAIILKKQRLRRTRNKKLFI